MSNNSENKNDQITFFGSDKKQEKSSDGMLDGFANEEHLDSASEQQAVSEQINIAPVPLAITEDEIELTTEAEVAPEHDVQASEPEQITFSELPRQEKAKRKLPFDFDYKNSLILAFIIYISNAIGKMFRNSLTASIFTSFSKNESAFSESYIAGKLTSQKTVNKTSKIKKTVRRESTNAYIPSFFSSFFSLLTGLKTRFYGLILLFFSATALGIHYFADKLFTWYQPNDYTPITAIITLISSLFLIFYRDTLLNGVKESVILSTLVFDFLGIKRPSFNEDDDVPFSMSASAFIGLVLGALTLIFPAHNVLTVILIAIYTFIAVKFPETGVISLIIVFPYLNNTALVYISSILAISYIFKILTGKRTPNFEFTDIFVAFFLLLTFISELLTFGTPSLIPMSSSFILVYFIAICALRNRIWFNRAIKSLTVSACIFAAYSVFVTFFGKWLELPLDYTLNTDFGDASASVINSTSVLAIFILCGIFYITASFFTTKSKSNRFAFILLIVLSMIYIFREASVAVIFALLIAFIIFMVIKSSKALIFVVAAAVILPLLPLFNSGVYSSLNVMINNEEYRLNIWSAVINMLSQYGFCGIGAAPDAFATRYATFYVGNTETIPHAHSMLLQTTISLGIPGLLLLITIFFFILQGAFSYGRNTSDKASKNRLFCYAGMCAVISLFISGIFENIWYNPKIVLLFWIICGLTVCARRSASDVSVSDQLLTELDQNYNG